MKRLRAAILSRPTLVAHGILALSSLALVTILTRRLTADDFATYSVVMATYAMGVALVGTTISTRAVEQLSLNSSARIEVVLSRDFLPLGLSILSAGLVPQIVGAPISVSMISAAGMASMLVDQLASAYLLGRQHFWSYALMVSIRVVLWVALLLILLDIAPDSAELEASLLACVLVAVIPAGFLIVSRGLRVRVVSMGGPLAPISGVGVASLSLWILASGDRLILAKYDLVALATYAAVYGLIDRVFRTISSAEFHRRLPSAFSSKSAGTVKPHGITKLELASVLGVAAISALLAPWAVEVISGGNYRPELWMTCVLTGAMVAMVCATPSFVSLIARGRHKEVAIIAIVPAAFNIGANLVLAPIYGTTSAALLTLFGYAMWLSGVLWADRTSD